MKRSGPLQRKTRLRPVSKKRAESLRLPRAVVTTLDVGGGVVATVHGDKPLGRRTEAAVREIVDTVLAAAPGVLRAVPKDDPPWRDAAFLAFVRKHRCCCCGRPGPSDADHVGPRAVGQKTDDTRAVPLCRACHRFRTDNRWLPLDREKTPTVVRANVTQAAQLMKRTRLRIAETQRELLVAYVAHRELAACG